MRCYGLFTRLPLVLGLLLAEACKPAWAQPAVLPIPASAGDQAGSDTAISGDYLIVGAPFDDGGGIDAGAAYVFRRTADGWTLDAKLTASDAVPTDRFGFSVALHGRVAVVGTPWHGRPVREIGIAYVFERDARGIWHQEAILRVPPEEERIGAGFGTNVAVIDDLVLVASVGGGAYLFMRDRDAIGTWKLIRRLTPPPEAPPSDVKVWVDSTSVLFGMSDPRRVYLYERDADSPGAWGYSATLTFTDVVSDSPFGFSQVLRHGDLILVGVPAAEGQSPKAGAVYVFVRSPDDPGAWRQAARLSAPDGATYDAFGSALAVRDDLIVVGAPGVDGRVKNAGAVYLLARNTNAVDRWDFVAKIEPPPRSAGFGVSLVMRSHELLVGASQSDRGGAAAGSVYLYDLSKPLSFEQLTFERVAHLEDGLTVPIVTAIRQDRRGFLWFGTMDGLYRYDGYEMRPYRNARSDSTALSNNQVLALLEDRRGALWVGTDYGLNRLDQACDCFARYPLYRPADAARQSVVALVEDRDGVVWTGTHGRLFRYDPTRDRFDEFEPFTGPPDVLDETYVSGIQQDRDGLLWVLAKNLNRVSHSLYRIDVDAGAVARFKVPDAWGQMGPLRIDRRGRFWVNAAEPLRFSEDGRSLLPPQRRPADVPWTIYEDRRGTIWHGTPSGLYRLEPHAQEATFHRLVEDVNESPANFVSHVYQDPAGALLLGTFGEGVYRIRPAWPGERTTGIEAPLTLTHIEVTSRNGTVEIAPDHAGELTLSYRDYNVAFRYAVLNYAPPGHNRYRYRLDGYDRDWVEAGTRRLAFYTNLPPGRYVFRVEASDASGTSVAQPVAQPLRITPPWWAAWWARLSAFAVLAGLVITAYRARVHRLLERERLRRLAEEKRDSEEEARRLTELDAAKSRFFANISHEFRTPLTLILGAADQLEQAAPQRSLDGIRRNAHRLLGLIDQLLDLSKLEADRLVLDPRPGDLATHLRQLVLRFAPLAERKTILLDFRTDLATLPVLLDAEKFSTIVGNLLSNALKFTPEGGKVLVTLAERVDAWTYSEPAPASTCAVDEAQGRPAMRIWAEVVVKDTGPGIPKEALPRIFDRFEQVDARVSGFEQSGTGIGLALARELVELHGGTILVESEVGFGAAFIVHIPFAAVSFSSERGILSVPLDASSFMEESERAQFVSERVPPEESDPFRIIGRPNILMVEDNAEVRALVRGYLERDYQVLEAADGEAGLAAARAHHPDLILCDVMMPGMDGLALCQALKNDETLCTVPVMLLTARASDDDAVVGLAAGADDYVAKPFHAAVLRAKIANLIAARRQMRERFSRELIVRPADVVVPSEEEAFLKSVLSVIDEHLGDTAFGVDSLVEAVALSRRQLERRLKGATGQTPAELIRQMRLERASQLLKAGAGSVAEIAYAVGYPSANYFSTAFREAFGHPPSDHFENAS